MLPLVNGRWRLLTSFTLIVRRVASVAKGKRAPPAWSTVGWFFPQPSQEYVVGSVAPDVCHLALVAARVPSAVLGEDAQSDSKPATTPDEPEAVMPVGTWPSFGVPEPRFRDGRSDSPVRYKRY